MKNLKIVIKNLDINNEEHLLSIAKWENDSELYDLVVPKKKGMSHKTINITKLKKRYLENPSYAAGVYLIFDQKTPIGTFSLIMDPEHLMKKIDGTSWLSITIGEKSYWGTNAATIAMDFFENESRKQGANRVELGTFEYNYRAQAFYKKLGYKEIGRLKNFTYWNGKYWDDIRMERFL